MKQYIISIGLFIALLVMSTSTVQAQGTTSSPMSMYGMGEMVFNNGGKYAGLGHAGVALNRRGFLNTLNPACLTRMDTTTFVFDVGATASYNQYKMLGRKESTGNGNVDRISLGFRLFSRWYTLIGMSPYTSTGYLINLTEEIEGSPGSYMTSVFEGNGGLFRLYVSNAFQLTKNLSLGVTLGMITGSIEQTESNGTATASWESTKRAFYADFGFYYQLTKNWAVAATYALPSNVRQDNEQTYVSSSTSSSLDQTYHTDNQYLPQTISGGVTYTNRRWTFTGDYSWKQWDKNKSSNSSVKYINQNQINIGAIYIPRLTFIRTPMEVMAGVGYGNSYVQLSNGKMRNLNVNAGVSFPIRESTLAIGVGWLKQTNSRSNLMQESRWSVSVNLTFGERLFRGKIQ